MPISMAVLFWTVATIVVQTILGEQKYLMKLTYLEGSEMSVCAFDSRIELIYKTKKVSN